MADKHSFRSRSFYLIPLLRSHLNTFYLSDHFGGVVVKIESEYIVRFCSLSDPSLCLLYDMDYDLDLLPHTSNKDFDDFCHLFYERLHVAYISDMWRGCDYAF